MSGDDFGGRSLEEGTIGIIGRPQNILQGAEWAHNKHLALIQS